MTASIDFIPVDEVAKAPLAPTPGRAVNLGREYSDSDWKGDTESRYTFHYGDAGAGPSKIRPFVGAKADYVYGSKVDDSLMAGPEAGVKVHVQPDTLVVLKTGYQSLYRDVRQIDEALDDGSFTYRIGVDFHF